MEATGRSSYPLQANPQTTDRNRLERTLEAARLLQSTLDLKELTRIILEMIRNEVPVDRVSVFVVDRKTDSIHSLVAQGVDGNAISMSLGKGIAGFVARTRQALDSQNPYADGRFNPEVDQELQYRTNDLLALPVLNGNGDVIGVLELLNRKKDITQEDREFLQDISVFIGLALQNAQMHEEIRNNTVLEEELTRSRERLAQLARFSLMNEVLSTVTRELASPLGIIRTHAALLREDQNLNPMSARYVEIIDRAAESSTEAINGFLNFIQQLPGERTAVNVTQLVRQIVAVRTANWLSDGIVAGEDLQETPAVIANAAEIQQALMNLIKNAEDAMATNTGPRLLTIRTDHDKVQNVVRILVADNGAGIAGQHYERIFEPFFSTKRGRTGLGLTIANRIVQEHRGTILLEANSDTTTFTIELPGPPPPSPRGRG